MSSSSQTLDRGSSGAAAAGTRVKLIPALLAACIGLVMLYASAFADMPAVHDAAHDGRHSAGFPCH